MIMFKSINATACAPSDDFWYNPIGGVSMSGVRVTSETSLRVSAVYACIKILSQSVAQLPLLTYEKTDQGKERAKDYYLYNLLKMQPNGWQTSYEFREFMESNKQMRGNGYAQIIWNRRGEATQLIPIMADRVKVTVTHNNRLLYVVKNIDGSETKIKQSDMFHIKGFSLNGYTGINVIEEYARNAVGISQVAQDYTAKWLNNDAQTSNWIELEGGFKTKEDRAKFVEKWQQSQSGANKGKTPVLESGMKMHSLQINNRDAQLIETMKFTIEDIARIFNVPGVMIHHAENTATYASAEQFFQSFLTHTLSPLLQGWEQAISRDLIVDTDKYFSEFNVAGLLRGTASDRAAFYASGIQNSWLKPNEARELENRNKAEGGDDLLQPMNIGNANRENALVRNAARVVSNKEINTIKAQSNKDGFEDSMKAFYAGHAEYVARTMSVSSEQANEYCVEQLNDALNAHDRNKINSLMLNYEHDLADKITKIGG